ncbi:MAG: FAD-binding oxidoreductase [Bauldia sp.]|nr:FAD-binding oxidoreductase [Bauldia sp.]
MARIAIVGGGIVGCAAASWLMAEGHAVTVYERDPAGRPASTGNAGLIALPEISPLARPGVITQTPRWLLDPVGPLAVRVRDLPALTPWLLRFIASARPDRVEKAAAALAWLMSTALRDHQELARRSGMSGHMRRTGALYITASEAGYRAAKAEWDERRRHGVPAEELDAAAARRLVPALTGKFLRAFHAPESWTVTSPLAILEALRRWIGASDALVKQEVIALRPDDREVSIITAEGADLPFDRVVIAGGVWSRTLVRGLGLRVLLETERGYNTTYPSAPIDLPMPVFFSDHGFIASPLAVGLRVGGAVEMAAPEAPPNFARAAAMRTVMRRYVPDLPETGGVEWMGCRPSTPDSMPVIGADPRDPRIVFAFGHGHLGLTLSAATARHVASLIAGRPDPKLAAFGIGRFQKGRTAL